jgi:ATP-binding cassette subfamily F protein 3
MMKSAALLLLDEPTNHFDVPAKEAIETALESYPGTVIVASHDRYFLDKVVKKIGEVEDGRLNIFLGNWTEFTEQRIGAGAGLLRGAEINDEPEEADIVSDAEAEAQEEELSAAIADLADLEVRLETAEATDRLTLLLERERLEKRIQELEDAWLKVSFDEPEAEPTPEPVAVKEPTNEPESNGAKPAKAEGNGAKPAKSGKKKK